MHKPTFDPGLTQRYDGPLRRIVNPDGTFNVSRRGSNWRDVHPYLHLVSVSWTVFFAWVLLAYVVVNLLFACVYYALGPNALEGSAPGYNHFLQCLFFSSQTLTTVGFGAVAPHNVGANGVAAFEALSGIMGIAVATGLLFGRVSKPSARIGFSEKALISPYQDGWSFQFRLVNRRANTLIEPMATLMMITIDPADGGFRREFKILRLERERLLMFPLMWTVVHPVDADSPLHGKSPADLKALQAEFLVLIKAWDETFAQTVHQRFSYRYDEIVWGGRFTPGFGTDREGNLQLHVNKVGSHVIDSSRLPPSIPPA